MDNTFKYPRDFKLLKVVFKDKNSFYVDLKLLAGIRAFLTTSIDLSPDIIQDVDLDVYEREYNYGLDFPYYLVAWCEININLETFKHILPSEILNNITIYNQEWETCLKVLV